MWDLRGKAGDVRGERSPSSVEMTLLQEEDDAKTNRYGNSNCSHVSQECTLLHTYKRTSERHWCGLVRNTTSLVLLQSHANVKGQQAFKPSVAPK